MLERLGFCVALLMLAPAGLEAQQASIQARLRVVDRIETQRLVAEQVESGPASAEAGVRALPSSWRWEVRMGMDAASSWSSAPVASGRGGEAPREPIRYSLQGSGDPAELEVSYLFAPI